MAGRKSPLVVAVLLLFALVAVGAALGASGDEQRAEAEEGASEERSGPRFIEGWGRVIDPDGGCTIEEEDEGELRVTVPDRAHDFAAELGRFNAPRVTRPVRGDMIAQVKISGDFTPAKQSNVADRLPYHGAGLILWKDRNNYVSVHRGSLFSPRANRRRHYLNFELRKDGEMVVSKGRLNIPDRDVYLRLERDGNRFYASVSPDRKSWGGYQPIVFEAPEQMKLGFIAINTAKSEFEVRFSHPKIFTLEKSPVGNPQQVRQQTGQETGGKRLADAAPALASEGAGAAAIAADAFLSAPGNKPDASQGRAASRFIPGWGRAVDPESDCTIEKGDEGELRITVPDRHHDFTPERSNAPRVTRPVRGDFIAQVKISGNFAPAEQSNVASGLSFCAAGLILWKNQKNYLSVHRAAFFSHRANRIRHYFNADLHREGEMVVDKGPLTFPDRDVYLRLERDGDRFYATISVDRKTWGGYEPVTLEGPEEMKLGFIAVNTAKSDFQVTFEEPKVFLLDRSQRGQSPRGPGERPGGV